MKTIMENGESVPFYKNRIVLIGGGIFLVLLLVLGTLFLSTRRSPSQKAPTEEETNTPGGSSSSGGANQVFAYPKKFKNTTIDSAIFATAEAQYKDLSDKEKNTYILDITQKYYSYRDALLANNIEPPAVVGKLTFNTMQSQVLAMEQLINDNLITSIDFVYIKARYRQSPNEEEVNKKYPNPQAKAKEVIEKYRQQFQASGVNIAQVLNASNQDPDLQVLNNGEQNKLVRNYTVSQDLLFNDKNFHPFLFSQKQNQVSVLYEPISQDGKPFGYMIVYPTNITFKPFYSIDQITYTESQNFSY